MSFSRFLSSIGILLLLVAPAQATTYFIANAGNDANNGTSSNTPWQHISKANSFTFSAGDTVQLNGGDRFPEIIKPLNGGTSGNPITYQSYGTGQAIVDGADIFTGWTLLSGSIYYTSAPTQVEGSVYVDSPTSWGLNLACGISNNPAVVSPCTQGNMSAGSWFWDSTTSRLYVWLADGSNPTLHTVEGGVRDDGFHVNTSSTTCAFCWITINNIHFHYGGLHAIYLHNFTATNVNAQLDGIVIENNTTDHTGWGLADPGGYLNQIQIQLDDDGAHPVLNPNSQIINNTASYCGSHNCIQEHGSASFGAISGNNVTTWNHNGIDVKNGSTTPIVVSNNYVHDEINTGDCYYSEQDDSRSEVITWHNNVCYTSGNGINCGGVFISDGLGGPGTITCNAYNNTMAANHVVGTCHATGQSATGGTSTFNVQNDICENVQSGLFNNSSASWTLSFDYNDYFPSPPSSGWRLNNAVISTFANWQASAISPDAHGKTVNPMFGGGEPTFPLQVGSPMIGAANNQGFGLNIGSYQGVGVGGGNGTFGKRRGR